MTHGVERLHSERENRRPPVRGQLASLAQIHGVDPLLNFSAIAVESKERRAAKADLVWASESRLRSIAL